MSLKNTAPDQMSAETVTEHDIVFDCPECRKLLVVDEEAAGLKVPCPQCGKDIEIPQQAHATRAIEHHDPSTMEEKLSLLENQMTENRMQHTEAVNKLNDHITQANRFKVRIKKLEEEYHHMEEELQKLTSAKK